LIAISFSFALLKAGGVSAPAAAMTVEYKGAKHRPASSSLKFTLRYRLAAKLDNR
jgi:hypothetical protein